MESSFLLDVDGGFYKTYDQVKPTAAARAEMRKKAGVSLPTPARRLVDYDDDDDDDDGDADDADEELLDAKAKGGTDTEDLDLMRVQHNGATGTVRTREGSNDTVIPATKAVVLYDKGQGEHVLLRRDEVAKTVVKLTEESDKVPEHMRAAKLLRGTPATKVEGTLLGAMQLDVDAPQRDTTRSSSTPACTPPVALRRSSHRAQGVCTSLRVQGATGSVVLAGMRRACAYGRPGALQRSRVLLGGRRDGAAWLRPAPSA
jgi:hypothetical protein